MTGNTRFVLLGALDRFARMNSIVQICNHIVMAACTLIKTEEISQGFIDLDRIGMQVCFVNSTVAFETRNSAMGRDMKTTGIQKPRGRSWSPHEHKSNRRQHQGDGADPTFQISRRHFYIPIQDANRI